MLIGIAGGSASGKSYLAQLLCERLEHVSTTVVSQDSYYKGIAPGTAVPEMNFDHPNAIDWQLLAEHMQALLRNESIAMPVYCFEKHCRDSEITVQPASVVILEGTMIYTDSVLTELCDLRVFLDIPDEIRLQRRLDRDVKARGRSAHEVLEQYHSFVKPMYEEHVLPTCDCCHEVVTDDSINDVTDYLIDFILNEHHLP